MHKKSVAPGILLLIFGAIASALVAIFIYQMHLLYVANGKFVPALNVNYVWGTVVFALAAVICIPLGLVKLFKAVRFNGIIKRSGTVVKKAEHRSAGEFFGKIGKAIANFFKKIGSELKDIVTTFIYGDWKTKVSYVIMGFGNIARGQVLRGLLFLLDSRTFLNRGFRRFGRSRGLFRLRFFRRSRL